MTPLRSLLLSLSRLLLLLLALPWGMQAQGWRADFTQAGIPSSALWRYDRAYFRQGDGRLQLQIPAERTAGTATLMTSLTLPPRPCWRGIVHLGLRPTSPNHPCLLLCATQGLAADSYEYVALDFGGVHSLRVTLARYVAQVQAGSPVLELRRDVPTLLTSAPLLVAGQDLAYEVHYTPEEGWTLYLQEVGSPEGRFLVGSNSTFTPALQAKNSFGITCHYTAKGRSAWSFRELSILAEEEAQPAPFPSSPADEDRAPAIYLSELLPHPEAGTPEYIELYNVSDHPQSLSDYLLGIGADEARLRFSPLPDILLPAHSYALLTTDAPLLQRRYPDLPEEGVLLSLPLRRLPNREGLVALKTTAGEIFDSFHYSASLLPRGLKSKAGLAFERRDFSAQDWGQGWQLASATAGYATPGRPASTSESVPPDEGAGLAEDLERLSHDPRLGCRWEVYTLCGLRLGSGEGVQGKEVLALLRQCPKDFLRYLTASPSTSPLVLRLLLRYPDGSTQRHDYLLAIHP